MNELNKLRKQYTHTIPPSLPPDQRMIYELEIYLKADKMILMDGEVGYGLGLGYNNPGAPE